MIKEPLFQDYIIETIIRNFRYYLFNTDWLYYAVGLLITLYGFFFILCKLKCATYPNLFPTEKFQFDRNDRRQNLSLAFLCLALTSYIFVIHALDDSLFNNYDLMSLNTIYTFYRGLAAYINPTRLAPISFFDLNFVYAVTHNYNLINSYIILKQIFITFLLYQFLNFIPVTKRLITIGCLLIIPSFFWINNIIFPEQNLLIFIISSLIFIKKYSETGKYLNLWFFILFTTLAVFTKENAIVFYSGIMFTGVMYNVFIEKINLSNIFKPLKQAKELPIESFIFLIGLSFAVFYFFMTETTETNEYIVSRIQTFKTMLDLYKYEIFITIIAWGVFFKKLLKNEIKNPLFNEGLLVGGTFVLLYILFHLKIVPIMGHVEHKSYYVLLTAIFNTIYIFQNIHSKKVLTLLVLFIICYSCIYNYKTYKTENGLNYREIAEFFGQELKKEQKLNIMFSSQSESHEWIRENWSSSFAYYFPNYSKDITFKFPHLATLRKKDMNSLLTYYRLRGYLTRVKGEGIPSQGDYYIIEKNKAEEDYKTIKNIPHNLVFENKRFKVYKIND